MDRPPVEMQLTIDCAEPARVVEFWALALGYQIEPPPQGHPIWNSYWRSVGVPDDELDPGRDNADSLIDPTGRGPRIWFQVVPERKSGKNRLHLDLKIGGGRTIPLAQRRTAVDDKVAELVAAGATALRPPVEGDQYAIVLTDPEGNEFCVV